MFRTEPGDVIGDPYTGYREVVSVMRAEDVKTGGEFAGSAAAQCARLGHTKILTKKPEPFRKD